VNEIEAFFKKKQNQALVSQQQIKFNALLQHMNIAEKRINKIGEFSWATVFFFCGVVATQN